MKPFTPSILVLLLALAAHSAFAQITQSPGSAEIALSSYQNVRIAPDACAQTGTCIAAILIASKPDRPEGESVDLELRRGAQNPANAACLSNNGAIAVYQTRTHDEILVCEFHDGSLLVLWDLLRAKKF